jgi:hypothetical protein
MLIFLVFYIQYYKIFFTLVCAYEQDSAPIKAAKAHILIVITNVSELGRLLQQALDSC